MTAQPDPILARLRDAMSSGGLDAVVATSPECVTYLSGAMIPSQRLVRSRLAAAIVPTEGTTGLVAVGLEGDLAREQSRLDELLTYEEFAEDPIAVIADAVGACGAAAGRVGLERTYVSVRDHDGLRAALPQATFEPVDELFENLRMVKTQPEIEALRRIASIAESSVREACAAVQPGEGERKLGTIIGELFGEGGGDALTMLVVASGPRSAHPNGPPTARRMSEGDLVRLDVIGTAGGYYCDVARTAVVGEPTADQQKIYDLLLDVHRQALDALRPGASGSDIYRIYAEAMADAGLPAYHFVGHGLGLSLHEQPFLNAHGVEPLRAGMVMCVEPLTFVSGELGVQIEDEAVITANGCELLTEAREMLRIGG